jgi:predicted ATPase
MTARSTSARFVGRERELNRLATALDATAAGRASSLLVTGAAGIGITRLLDEAQLRLERLPSR